MSFDENTTPADQAVAVAEPSKSFDTESESLLEDLSNEVGQSGNLDMLLDVNLKIFLHL